MKVTKDNLEHEINRVNLATGSPLATWTKTVAGNYTANVGNYHLSGAYGGWQLQRICTEGGGVSVPFGGGYVSKAAMYAQLQAFLAGVNHEVTV